MGTSAYLTTSSLIPNSQLGLEDDGGSAVMLLLLLLPVHARRSPDSSLKGCSPRAQQGGEQSPQLEDQQLDRSCSRPHTPDPPQGLCPAQGNAPGASDPGIEFLGPLTYGSDGDDSHLSNKQQDGKEETR
jgi:hypothetical protein